MLFHFTASQHLLYCSASAKTPQEKASYFRFRVRDVKLNSMGPTPTRTLRMRLSCNFVNVYTIVYHVQYTYTCTRAHPQRTSSRGKARVSDKSPRTSRRRRRAERAARAEARRADFRARRTRRREEVRVGVGVGVSVGPVEFKLISAFSDLDITDTRGHAV